MNNCKREVVIVSAARTPIGSYGGAFKGVSAIDLGAVAAKEAIKRAGIKPEQIDEVIMGNVLQAGLGQNVARQVSIKADIPVEVPSFTLNKVCGSGLKSIALAAYEILADEDKNIILAGGTENMSNAPYLLKNNRWGQRMGDGVVEDYMVKDGLWDVFNDYHMGITAENVAEQYEITREEQDIFACESQNKAEKARADGKFKDEIVSVSIPQRKGDPIVVSEDEYIRVGATVESLAKLRPAFKKDGTVTAGNASGINDGAAAVIVMSKEKADELGLTPICKIVAVGEAGVDPKIMGTGPIPATKKALKKAGLEIKDLDLVEANEAFAAQALAVAKDLGLNKDIVNVNGGAIALGHPIGASGTRIFVTLIHEMMKRDAKKGLATLCIGGGQGISIIVERP